MMVRKMGVNFVCVVLLLVSVFLGNSGVFAQSGVDSFTKLMLHADGADQGTAFTDSETTPKTVTNTESYDSFTKLMLHTEGSGNSFTDSAASKAVTANGDVTQTTAQFKLGSNSAVFDGNGDYLSLADSDDWNFGSGDFTIDFWMRLDVAPSGSEMNFVNQFGNPVVSGTSEWACTLSASGRPQFYFFTDGSYQGLFRTTSVPVFNANQWYHLAFVRNGSNAYIFIDGVSQDVTMEHPLGTPVNLAASLQISQRSTSSQHSFHGWLDELRISKGIARWTSNFTPPSSPYGKVATVTSQKKFGTASGEFKGSGDYLSLADSDDWNFGSGDFTIDFWFRRTDTRNDASNRELCSQKDAGFTQAGTNFVIGIWRGLQYVRFSNGSAWKSIDGPTTLLLDTWYHYALVRNGNTLTAYVNGISDGSVDVTGVTGEIHLNF